jgi:hypothetical protein
MFNFDLAITDMLTIEIYRVWECIKFKYQNMAGTSENIEEVALKFQQLICEGVGILI